MTYVNDHLPARTQAICEVVNDIQLKIFGRVNRLYVHAHLSTCTQAICGVVHDMKLSTYGRVNG